MCVRIYKYEYTFIYMSVWVLVEEPCHLSFCSPGKNVARSSWGILDTLCDLY